MVHGCCSWSTSLRSVKTVKIFLARISRREILKSQVPVWPEHCQRWSRKPNTGAQRQLLISDNLDKHRPDIPSDEGERAGIHPVRMHFPCE